VADQDKKVTNPAPSGSDPDRSAILKRRQKFIAAAIVGLAVTGPGCIADCEDGATKARHHSDKARPSKCLKMKRRPKAKSSKLKVAAAERAARRAAAEQAAQEERAGKQKAKQKGKSGGKR